MELEQRAMPQHRLTLRNHMRGEAVGQVKVDGPRDGVMFDAATPAADTVQTDRIHGEATRVNDKGTNAAELDNAKGYHHRSEHGREKRKAKKAKLQKARRASLRESQRQMNEAEDTDVSPPSFSHQSCVENERG